MKEEHNLFERSKNNRLALFGQDTPRLVELIQSNKHLFSKFPIGPIGWLALKRNFIGFISTGNCIKLKDPRWANVVEFALRNIMGTFLCDSGKDRLQIDELCKVNNLRTPEIITVK